MLEVALEVIDAIASEGGDSLRLCYQCGTCTDTCPWNQMRNFSVRRIIHLAQLGLVDFSSEDIWRCVACKLCVQACPRGVEITDVMQALRRVNVEVGAGSVPDSLRITAKNIASLGNPLGEPREKRIDWARNLGIKMFTPEMEMLYFPCCYQAYDPRGRKVALAAINILKKANVDFGILGYESSCCGESIRKAGYETLFRNLAQNNINIFQEAGVKRILVSSPHCYNCFKTDYQEFGTSFEVIHLVQYLVELMNEGRLKFSGEIKNRVTYHDSCCLGRYAGIYDEPRQILQAIPGVELVEMRDTRELALCCGGCAGGLWQEAKKGERFADLRLSQALEAEAQILAVACPYCLIMFEDSALGTGAAIQIKDIAELALEAI